MQYDIIKPGNVFVEQMEIAQPFYGQQLTLSTGETVVVVFVNGQYVHVVEKDEEGESGA